MGFALKSLSTQVTEPVALTDTKAHLNVAPDFTDDDALIGSLISAARQDAEDYLGHSLAQQQWLFVLDSFPYYRLNTLAPSRPDYDAAGNYTFAGYRALNEAQTIRLPRPPLVSVDSLQYIDTSGTLQTLDPSTYVVDTISQPGRLLPAVNAVWPLALPTANAVQISFTAGVGTLAPNTVLAIKLRAAKYYQNREDYSAGTQPLDGLFERMLGNQGRTNIFGYVGR